MFFTNIYLFYLLLSGHFTRHGPGRGLHEVEAGDHGHEQAGRDLTDSRHERRHRASRHSHFRYVQLADGIRTRIYHLACSAVRIIT